jgi:mercuric ion binding protein
MKTNHRSIRPSRAAAAFSLVVALAFLGAAPAAETKTVTLSVPGMTCAACPITVKKALTKVEGVVNAEVSLEKKQAVVTYDSAKTSVEELKEAAKNAGYPATEKH